jgi:hypothetical protein
MTDMEFEGLPCHGGVDRVKLGGDFRAELMMNDVRDECDQCQAARRDLTMLVLASPRRRHWYT